MLWLSVVVGAFSIAQVTPQQFDDYFKRAAEHKVERIQKLRNGIIDREAKMRTSPSSKPALVKEIAGIRREIKEVEDMDAFVPFSANPEVGQLGILEQTHLISSVTDDVSAAWKGVIVPNGRPSALILKGDIKKVAPKSKLIVSPDIWVVTAVGSYTSIAPGLSDHEQAAIRHAQERTGKRYCILELVPKADVMAARKAHARGELLPSK